MKDRQASGNTSTRNGNQNFKMPSEQDLFASNSRQIQIDSSIPNDNFDRSTFCNYPIVNLIGLTLYEIS